MDTLTFGKLARFISEELSAIADARESDQIMTELFRHYNGMSRVDRILKSHEAVPENDQVKLMEALQQLKQGIPLQYITSQAWFCGLPFEVSPGVLIPRPETEELVQLASSLYHPSMKSALDIGTGSGCIAISLKSRRPGLDVHACDISGQALNVAGKNAAHCGVQVMFHEVDILSNKIHGHSWDLIVSNPPYIPETEGAKMAPRVTEHEPHLALFVPDNDPLIFYRRILRIAREDLNPDGYVLFEIHENHGLEMKALCKSEGFDLQLHQDAQGRERMVVAQRQ